jgi:transposase
MFNTWIEKVLLKELKSGQTVIMDHVSFHKSERTQELIEDAGRKVIYLLSYSPNLNPKFWTTLKKWMQKGSFYLTLFHSFLIGSS